MTKFRHLDPEEKIREFIDQDTLYENEMSFILDDPDAIVVMSLSEQELAYELKDIEDAVAAKIELVSEMIGDRRPASSSGTELTPANSNVPLNRENKVKIIACFAAGMLLVSFALPFGWFALGEELTGRTVEGREINAGRLVSHSLIGGEIPDGRMYFADAVPRRSVVLDKAPRGAGGAAGPLAVVPSSKSAGDIGEVAGTSSHFTQPLDQRLVELVSEQRKKIDEIYAMLAVERAFNISSDVAFVQMPQSFDLNSALWSVQYPVDVTKKPKAPSTEISSAAPHSVLGRREDHLKNFDPSFVKWSVGYALGEF